MSSALERAEALGVVELDGQPNDRRACIVVGTWNDVVLRVWGKGSTTEQALESAISRFHIFTKERRLTE